MMAKLIAVGLAPRSDDSDRIIRAHKQPCIWVERAVRVKI